MNDDVESLERAARARRPLMRKPESGTVIRILLVEDRGSMGCGIGAVLKAWPNVELHEVAPADQIPLLPLEVDLALIDHDLSARYEGEKVDPLHAVTGQQITEWLIWKGFRGIMIGISATEEQLYLSRKRYPYKARVAQGDSSAMDEFIGIMNALIEEIEKRRREGVGLNQAIAS
jgi:hypothetical protein